ncbi:hypothetical protein MPSEU_001005700 [Mayamaea pseudoterrestris]|nr:hypothetical protein MPSEU_001005700 [Mayamaea pseudoterrestris]
MPSAPASLTISNDSHARTHSLLLQSIFMLLGVAVLVPWNAFISAKDYLSVRLGDCGGAVESTIAIIFNVSSVSSLTLLMLWQWNNEAKRDSSSEPIDDIDEQERAATTTTPSSKTAKSQRETPAGASNRNHAFIMVMGSLTLNLAVFVIQCCLVLVLHLEKSTTRFMILTNIGLTGLTGSVATAGVVLTCTCNEAMTSMLHPYFQGQAIGGLLVSLMNFMAASYKDPSDFTQKQCHDNQSANDSLSHFEYARQSLSVVDASGSSSSDSDCSYERIDWAVFGYFVTGSLLLVASIAGYLHVYRLQKYNYEPAGQDDEIDLVLTQVALSNIDGLEMQRDGTEQARPTSASLLTEPYHDQRYNNGLVAEESSDGIMIECEVKTDLYTVYKLMRAPAWCIFLTFVVTLAVFPGWTSQLQSAWRCQSTFRIANDLYTPLTFALFNAGDLTGRILSGRVPMDLVSSRDTSKRLVLGALLRVPLALLLFTCLGASQRVFPFVVPSDLYSFAMQFLFAASNGFLVTLAFAHAPSLLEVTGSNLNSGAQQERMSEILSFSLSLGLLVGSLCSYPVSKLGH